MGKTSEAEFQFIVTVTLVRTTPNHRVINPSSVPPFPPQQRQPPKGTPTVGEQALLGEKESNFQPKRLNFYIIPPILKTSQSISKSLTATVRIEYT